MAGVARARLMEERKAWRRDRPFGFFAKLDTLPDGSQDLMKWRCGIPGKTGTNWEGGMYKILIQFSEDYPLKPPKCSFAPNFFHPNIFPSGTVCLSILNEEEGWQPGISIKQILMGIQDLLDNPNPLSPAQTFAYNLYMTQRSEYDRRVREQAKANPPEY